MFFLNTFYRIIISLFLFSFFLLHNNCLAGSPSSSIPDGIFGYQERVGNKIIPFNWKAEKNNDGVAITVYEDNKMFYNLCSPDGKTEKWQIQVSGEHDIKAERHGNNLFISGTRSGKKYSKTVGIDDRPWYQPLSFSLGRFLDSERKETSFWIIRADTIEVLALTAKKIGEEKIPLGEENVSTQKIEVRAEGFFSRFWSAVYWYRKSDNLFIRYQSVHGLPGTDQTVVELVNTPSGLLGS